MLNPTLSLAVALACAASLTQAAPAPKAQVPANSAAAAPAAELEIPVSTFVIPSTPAEGRNPFYPKSTQFIPAPRPTEIKVIDTSVYILNGITPRGPRRTAMVNGYTFETGEEHEVKLPSGAKSLIKVEEIKDDSVVISVGSLRKELRLRSGL